MTARSSNTELLLVLTADSASNGMLNDHTPLQRVVLIGFMGSGKTTVGRLLAHRLAWTFLDLDDEVAQRCDLSVSEIFSRFGEARFRHEESVALAACLTRSRIVLALGGGTLEAEANRAVLRDNVDATVIYLEGSFETLLARCAAQATEPGTIIRPLLGDATEASNRFAKRSPFYAEAAIFTLPVDHLSPQELTDRLERMLA